MKAALDIAEVAAANDRVDRAIEAASETVEGHLRRRFYPWTGTRYFDWPDETQRPGHRLWLYDAELISLSSLTSGGTSITAGQLVLYPRNGPPYNRIETNLATSAAWQAGPTTQDSVAITGTFGYRADEEAIGTLSGTLAASATASPTVTLTSARVGVGDLLRIDSERMLVTERTMASTAQTLQTPLTDSAANVTVAVTDGTAFRVEDVLQLDSERMRVTSITGNNLTVRRAHDGTVLAAHTGSTIYALTGLTVTRAAVGTTLAEHTSSPTVYRHLVPPLVRDLAVGLAVNQLVQESAAYGRPGAGEAIMEATGKGLGELKRDADERFGRILLSGV